MQRSYSSFVLILVSSLACFLVSIANYFVLGIFNYSTFFRPVLFFLFSLIILSRGQTSALLLRKAVILAIFRFILLVGVAQSVFCLLQSIYPTNALMLSISRLFANDLLVDTTLAQYGRALGFMGGPAATGVFSLVVILISYLLFKLRYLPSSTHFLLISSQALSILLCFSKGAAFVVFCWFVIYFLSFFYRSLGLPRRYRFVVSIASGLVIFMVSSYVLLSLDVHDLRAQSGLSSWISGLFRTSSLYGRLSYLSFNLISAGNFWQIFFGGLPAPSVDGTSRVFDSDLLYFTSTYGVSGLILFLALSSLIVQLFRFLGLPVLACIVFLFSIVFNPTFTSLLPLPFLLFLLATPSLLSYRASHHYGFVK